MATLLHSDSGGRVFEVEERLNNELAQLVKDIWRVGDPEKPEVQFGELFDDDDVQQHYEGLAATLKAAKKRGIVTYKSPLLLKGAHDKVMVNLVDQSPLPAGMVAPVKKSTPAAAPVKKSAPAAKPAIKSAPKIPPPSPVKTAPVAPPAREPSPPPPKETAKETVAPKKEAGDSVADELMAFSKRKTGASDAPKTTTTTEPAKPPQSAPVSEPAAEDAEAAKESTAANDVATDMAALAVTEKEEAPDATISPPPVPKSEQNGSLAKDATSETPKSQKESSSKSKKGSTPKAMLKKFSFSKKKSSSSG